ncbi:TetR/AcrR family transcriptional regulator [Fervidibacillus halotolerans]|uniref:TetR/AcrR family transcriptional regulator n=1 Tax=Fervidibacillus halotolerans TaxID=2980027 RepID=A0A9E8RXR4_9BACI|nr:TetR/AcrR family transcriptional regulator [Fervidibacillus halotolerans]WAA12076.1 TetR/AcrR family transcriptional regulator [Fervidibacillus halotolerans]
MSLREKKIAKKREDILRSAVKIISEKGYHKTTLEDIAAHLYMTKGSIYYYFKDKQDLIYQTQAMLIQESIENIKNVIEEQGNVTEKLRRAMIKHIEFVIRERMGFSIGIKPEQVFEKQYLEKILHLRGQYESYFDRIITMGVEEKVFHPVDVKIVRNLLLGAMNWVVQWYSPEGKKDVKELAETISDYLLRILLKGGENSTEEM